MAKQGMQLMNKVNFAKFLRKKDARLLIEQFILVTNDSFAIEDDGNNLLLGNKVAVEPLPIIINDELIGWLRVANKADVTLNFIHYLLTKEVEKKDLANETLGLYKEINLLYKLSEKIKANFNIGEIAHSIIDEAHRVIRSTHASVMLYSAKTKMLEVIASIGDTKATKKYFPANKGIAGHIFLSGNAEIINNTCDDMRFVQGYCPMGSLLCSPIKAGNHTVGVINLSHDTVINYSAADLKLFCALVSQGAIALENALLHEKIIKEEQVKHHLERYVSSRVVDAIMNSEDDLALEPEKLYISILFSDIRGFTHLCELLDSAEIVTHLNTYFENMVDIIFEQQGTINKFVGDMIIALFGAPKYLADSEKYTVTAAIKMQQWLELTDYAWIKENFKTGIGINSGKVVVGNIGSPKHIDYTAIGDEVNLASRLQALAEAGQILVSKRIYEATQNCFEYRYYGNVTVKGKEHAIDVYEVIY